MHTRLIRLSSASDDRAGSIRRSLASCRGPLAVVAGNPQWIAQADRDEGRCENSLTTAEREELNHLRQDHKQLKLERESLSEAAAWFARKMKVIP